MASDQAVANRKAEQMATEARELKRASNRLKKKARLKLQQLDEFVAACEARGIAITINTQPEQGGHGVNSNTQEGQAIGPLARHAA